MDAALLVFGLSLHNPDTLGAHNAFNPGIGLVVQEQQARILAGGYWNSESRSSFFIGGGGEIGLTRRMHLTLNAALVTGYEPIPVVAPIITLAYDFDPITLHAAALPGAVAIFAEYRL